MALVEVGGKPPQDNSADPTTNAAEKENAVKESGKKGKKARKKNEDWEDDVAKELEDMTLDETGGKKEETPEPQVVEKEKKKEKVRFLCMLSCVTGVSAEDKPPLAWEGSGEHYIWYV